MLLKIKIQNISFVQNNWMFHAFPVSVYEVYFMPQFIQRVKKSQYDIYYFCLVSKRMCWSFNYSPSPLDFHPSWKRYCRSSALLFKDLLYSNNYHTTYGNLLTSSCDVDVRQLKKTSANFLSATLSNNSESDERWFNLLHSCQPDGNITPGRLPL